MTDPPPGWERGQRIENGGRYAIGIEQDVVVPEANDAEAFALEPGGARQVVGVIGVLRSVRLDDKPRPKADEIDDVIAKLLLPFELPALEAVRAEDGP